MCVLACACLRVRAACVVVCVRACRVERVEINRPRRRPVAADLHSSTVRTFWDCASTRPKCERTKVGADLDQHRIFAPWLVQMAMQLQNARPQSPFPSAARADPFYSVYASSASADRLTPKKSNFAAGGLRGPLGARSCYGGPSPAATAVRSGADPRGRQRAKTVPVRRVCACACAQEYSAVSERCRRPPTGEY